VSPWRCRQQTGPRRLNQPGIACRHQRSRRGLPPPACVCYARSAMQLHDFLVGLLVLLSVAAVSLAVFGRLGLGSVLGLLAAGLVIGPTGFDLARRVSDIRHFSELGVVLLMFVIGLEMRPARLWEMRRVA